MLSAGMPMNQKANEESPPARKLAVPVFICDGVVNYILFSIRYDTYLEVGAGKETHESL